MSGREIVLVVARADNGVIGRDGALPWHIPADLRRFRTLTTGAPMVMGRRTFASLPGLLPGRRHVVLTRDTAWCAAGAEPVASPDAALAAAGDGRVSVIGGAEVFALFLPLADRIELTEVHAAPAGDTRLPPFAGEWRETGRDEIAATAAAPALSFVTLRRESGPSN